ncbi:Type II secretion system protein G precursor [Maioricimonas rarisocia]|uniref:Type II secretion system protein G n=1 Tax=Maioricimonas rarisocia TaxID=2528026 RepID=A0A517Z191_9PLAN|nr:type II secretion system protein [Maioricimonas rarisocia]QDU36238.1 Type II secretion system protein G precursor [Maioricimonas rarisocia]
MNRPFVARTCSRRHRGFTLIELVIVVLVIGILAATVAPRFTKVTDSSRESSVRENLRLVRQAIELHLAHHGSYPGDAGTEVDFKSDLQPYLKRFPVNHVDKNEHGAVKMQTTGTAMTGMVPPSGGWRYDNVSGQFMANSNGISSTGDWYHQL